MSCMRLAGNAGHKKNRQKIRYLGSIAQLVHIIETKDTYGQSEKIC